MNASSLRVHLDSTESHYQPGEQLTGRFFIHASEIGLVRAAELSVLWYTAGKGDEDMFVHHFERLVGEASQPLDLRQARRFSTVLPASPLSYDGIIVKICWCVRLRIFLPQGEEALAELPFRVGSVPATSHDLLASRHADIDGLEDT